MRITVYFKVGHDLSEVTFEWCVTNMKDAEIATIKALEQLGFKREDYFFV